MARSAQQRSTGTKPTGSGAASSSSSESSDTPSANRRFVVCALGMLRVIDESGEDYLYPAERFLPIVVPAAIARVIERDR